MHRWTLRKQTGGMDLAVQRANRREGAGTQVHYEHTDRRALTSRVCGMTPSSAATTSTATSVTLAPRFRIALNAACPGVSSNNGRAYMDITHHVMG